MIFWLLMDIFFQPASPRNLLEVPEVLLFSIILYPLLEEMVFRGLIQGQLMRKVRWRRGFMGVSGANLVTSVLFALLHVVHQAPLIAALIVVPSLIFGYFRDRHRSVLPGIWLHVFYNAGFITLFSLGWG